MTMELLVATSNQGKAREFAEMFGDLGLTCTDLSAHPGIVPPEETGATFRANAGLKASYYAKATGQWTLADDSGLEVDAIGRRPGVHSARWAEIHSAGKGDAENNRLLIHQLDGVPDEQRQARFVCVLALADPQGRVILTARDTIEGRMLRSPRGAGGFGYDPLFLVESLGRTTAELASADKHRISHRGKAMRTLHDLIVKHVVFK
jgi:XTP/dITP diphosphohydrolase